MKKVYLIFVIFQLVSIYPQKLTININDDGIKLNNKTIRMNDLKMRKFNDFEYKISRHDLNDDAVAIIDFPIRLFYYSFKSGKSGVYISVEWDSFYSNYSEIIVNLNERFIFSNTLSEGGLEKIYLREGIEYSRYENSLSCRYDSSCSENNQNISSITFSRNGWLGERITTPNGLINMTFKYDF